MEGVEGGEERGRGEGRGCGGECVRGERRRGEEKGEEGGSAPTSHITCLKRYRHRSTEAGGKGNNHGNMSKGKHERRLAFSFFLSVCWIARGLEIVTLLNVNFPCHRAVSSCVTKQNSI